MPMVLSSTMMTATVSEIAAAAVSGVETARSRLGTAKLQSQNLLQVNIQV